MSLVDWYEHQCRKWFGNTPSGYAARYAERGHWPACLFCAVLHWIDPLHCERQIEQDDNNE